MSTARIQAYLDETGSGLRVLELEENISTSQLAADALGVQVGQIAKSLVYKNKDSFFMVVAAGDVRLDSKLLKKLVGGKVRMATPEETLEVSGYSVGGVCPFLLATSIPIYIDESLGRFPVVYSAAGTSNSALPISYQELLEKTGGLSCAVSMAGE
ncbi:MAG: YbaK/EbsC family protein [Syntrophomonadaceae bacterium]|nr:YbaK/EbsC family protein [Syntrophomonadaceae bacterium]